MWIGKRDVTFDMIVAVDEEFGFGKDGKIPWRFKEDFKWFKEQTANSPCIMGRRTYNDLIEMNKTRLTSSDINPLEGRQIFVLSRKPKEIPIYGNTLAFESIDEIRKHLLTENKDSDNIRAFLCGGRRVYEGHMSMIRRVYLTLIEGDYECDVELDLVNLTKGKRIIHHSKAIEDGKELKFLIYE